MNRTVSYLAIVAIVAFLAALGGTITRAAENDVVITQRTATGQKPVVLADPGADRILFWRESVNEPRYLTLGSGLTITGTTITSSASGGTWGSITGTLSSQTDLQTALNGKLSTSGTAALATALATARTINGTAFDGTANITITSAAGTLTGSTLNSGITGSSLTSLGTLTSLGLSGAVTGTLTALGTTTTAGLILLNTTAAASGAQQVSPSLTLTGQGWKTTATAASQSTSWTAYVLPVQGTTAPTSQLLFTNSVAGGAPSTSVIIHSSGKIQAMGGSYNVPSLLPSNASLDLGIGSGGSSFMHFIVNSEAQAVLSNTGFSVNGNHSICWGSGGGLGNADGSSLKLYRNEGNWLQVGTDSATPAGNTISGADGVGTNIVGGSITFASGRGTGSAAGGDIIFSLSRSGGSSGTTQGANAEAVRMLSTGTVEIKNATTVPASNPTGGGYLYIDAGALKYRGSSGTVTTIANP